MFGLAPETIVMLATTAFSFWAKMNAQKNADMMSLLEARTKSRKADTNAMNAAAKRSNPMLRKILGTIVITFAFGGIILAPCIDVPMTLIEQVPQHSILFGLIKFGSGIKVISAEGIVYPPFVRESVMAIIGFVFGPGFAKVTRHN
jgi:hypothetical protein